ncbi:MAG: hypothetical protein PHV37_07005 [Candidatus Gastranaerophilales bacterium]|nr:hypothetical protein [Candidatus Gastranaerophilales bacterium]
MKKLCNIFVLICAAFILSLNTAFAADFSQNTSNATLTSALNVLESANKQDVLTVLGGNNPSNKPIKVMFRNLEVYGYGKCEAVTGKTNNGGYVIFINKIHETAPAEAIACLIAHESVHVANGCDGTFSEELRAWTMETRTWISLSSQNPTASYDSSRLVKRENYLSKLYNRDGQQTTSIENLIATNSAYQNLK